MSVATYNVIINAVVPILGLTGIVMAIVMVYFLGYARAQEHFRNIPRANCLEKIKYSESGTEIGYQVDTNKLSDEQAIIFRMGARQGVKRFQADMLKEICENNRIPPLVFSGDYISDPNYPDVHDIQQSTDLIQTANIILGTKRYIDDDE